MRTDIDSAIEQAVRVNLCRVIDEPVEPGDLDLDGRLVDHYGLTSLNRVLFLTSVCDETGVGLAHFTEQDVARMATPRDVVAALVLAARSEVVR
jgi:hypothetical protein